jgi:Fe-S-cluster containining protein
MSSLRFECTQCGKCCRVRGAYAHVYLNDSELDALAAHVGLPRKEFRWRFTVMDELGWTELAFQDDHCPFLDPDSNLCTVHEARPTQCRTFPFWRDFVRDGKWTTDVAEMCEGIGRGEAWSEEIAETLMAEQEAVDDED